MTYHDSLWKDAPVGATHWIVFETGNWTWWLGDIAPPKFDAGTICHPRPTAYTPAAQLVDQYRKEHPKVADDAAAFFDGRVFSDAPLSLDHLIDDTAFHLALLERYLAAERARVEGAE